MSRNEPAVASAAPTPSRRRDAGFVVWPGRSLPPTMSTYAATGTLTRKIMRQPVPSRSALIRPPATIGPSIADRPATGPNTPHALPISCGGKRSRMSPNTCGTMTAPTAPWTMRKAISAPVLGAAAAATDATANPATPTSSIRLRPNRSPSRPPMRSITAIASV